MRNIFFAFALALLFFSASVFSQSPPINDDFQIWNDTSVVFPLLKSKDKKGKEFDRLTFSINGTLRLGRNASRLVDKRIGFGLSYRLNKYLTFAPDYLYRSGLSVRNINQYEHRVRFAVTPENKWKRFSLADRNQIEYRIRNSRDDTVFYRNRLRFDYPIKKNAKEIFDPFVSDEIFYDFSEKKLTRDQLFAGINKKFNKNFAAEFYYLFLRDRSSPKTINGIGINFKFKLSEFNFR